MRIEKDSHGGAITVRLIGDFRQEDLSELKRQLKGLAPPMILDLKEVTVVDVDVVRFFAVCQVKGVKFIDCPRYIREWISRERKVAREEES